jgi:hypothetical protein
MSDQRGCATAEFGEQLEKLIDYFSMEFDLSIAQVIGVMEVAKMNVLLQHMNVEDEEEDRCDGCSDE